MRMLTAYWSLMDRGPTVMRGKAIDRALIAQKLFPEDIDARVRKVDPVFQYILSCAPRLLVKTSPFMVFSIRLATMLCSTSPSALSRHTSYSYLRHNERRATILDSRAPRPRPRLRHPLRRTRKGRRHARPSVSPPSRRLICRGTPEER